MSDSESSRRLCEGFGDDVLRGGLGEGCGGGISGDGRKVGGTDGHGFEGGVVEVLGEGVFDEEGLELELGAGDGEVAFAIGDFGFVLHDVEGGDGLEVEFFAGGGEGLVGEVERTGFDLLVFVGADEIPVDIGDLGDGGDDLELEGLVGDFLVVAGDAEVAEVGAEAEAG